MVLYQFISWKPHYRDPLNPELRLEFISISLITERNKDMVKIKEKKEILLTNYNSNENNLK